MPGRASDHRDTLWSWLLHAPACTLVQQAHLVVSKASPLEATSGVALLERGAPDVTDRGDPAELCIRSKHAYFRNSACLRSTVVLKTGSLRHSAEQP